MTAPDSPAVTRVRAALDAWAPDGDVVVSKSALDGVLAELAQAKALAENWRVIAQANRIGTAERERRALEAPETPAAGRAEPGTDPAREAGRDDLSAPHAPTERLRLAAAELERRAAAATPGPWQPEYGYLNRSRVQAVFVECGAGEDGCDGVDCIDGTHGIGGFDLDGDNRWAILANPQLAALLAPWMRAEADRPERRAWDDQVLYLAVDVAGHILRGTP